MIAPEEVCFYTSDWQYLGSKKSMAKRIEDSTGISNNVLRGSYDIDAYSVAQRMSWAANRRTTRTEDIAYCLMGLFGVHMPLLYGEGHKAFQRLQEAIIKSSSDHSLFAWCRTPGRPGERFLSSSPYDFRHCGRVIQADVTDYRPYSTTNIGLRIKLLVRHKADPLGGGTGMALLNCQDKAMPDKIIASRLDQGLLEEGSYFCVGSTSEVCYVDRKEAGKFSLKKIYLRKG